jgi:hypothetical protein
VCTEASTVLRAVAADFFFNCWCLEILSDNSIQHVPRCIHYHEQGFRWGWDVEPCGFIINRRFGETCFLHFQDIKNNAGEEMCHTVANRLNTVRPLSYEKLSIGSVP